jgi:hypothetical protein
MLNLENYIYLDRDCLSKDFCNELLDELKTNEGWETHQYFNEYNKQAVVHKNEPLVCGLQTNNGKLLQDKLWFVIQDYLNQEVIRNSIHPLNTWNGYEAVRFNCYSEKTEMRYHVDHIQTMFSGEKRGIPTLSIVGLLNDDFEGGEFEFFGNKKMDLSAGSVMVFPSIFLYPHAVYPVRFGKRYSFVSWVW